MSRDLEDLRRELATIDRGPGCWYPDAFRRRVATWTRRRRSAGASWRELADEVGLSAETLRRWGASSGGADEVQVPVVPIEIVADADAAMVPAARGGLRIITRGGLRIEGLAVADAIAIARVLG